MNKTNAVHQLKNLNVYDYAVSRKVIESKPERGYTGGGVGPGGSAERFGPPLGFLCYFLWAKPKKVNKRLRQTRRL